MIKNYFKIAWRNLIRNKAFSVLNIAGLASGIACSLLILLWVNDERSVDNFHTNGKQLYQIYERDYYDGKVTANYATQGLLASELKRTIPEIEYTSSLDAKSNSTFEAGGKIIKVPGCFAGADFFKMFSYRLLQGTAETALNAINSVAISRSVSENFFGSPENAIGKTIRFENRTDLLITAVFENLPVNSAKKFNYLRSWDAYVAENPWVQNWGNTDPATFIQLKRDADPIKVKAKIKNFVYNYKAKNKGSLTELDIQPYGEKYLHSTFNNGYVSGGRIEYVRLFTIIGIFIILIACINFMNLATARSAKRAKEVGLRKVIGAVRSSLIGQFIGEAILITFFSVILAVVLASSILPAFNSLTGKQLFIPVTQPGFWAGLIGIVILTGFIAGSYPALFLSSLKPIKVLKGSLKFSRGATFFRQGLVVFQFSLAVLLIVGMIVIFRQMDYIQNKNLGYDRENLIYIPIEGELVQKYSLFKQEAGKLGGVQTISRMRNSPTIIGHHTGNIEWSGKDPDLLVSFVDAVVGYDFVKTLNLKLKEGRDFSQDFGTDSASFLLNETAVRKIGYTNPIGKTVTWGNHPGKIVGILNDFHFNSMHQEIEPLIVRLDEKANWGNIMVRTQAGKTKQALAGLEAVSKTLNPKFPFTYQFSDEEFTNLYKSEMIVSKLSGIFAFLAIFISCLGLFGLAAFTAEQRVKEIGVRKVLGASIPDIIALLTGSFLKPVAIAILISIPLAFYIMNLWLENYAYKINTEWWIFALAGIFTIGIAILTVSFQSIKASLMNPVKNLRAE